MLLLLLALAQSTPEPAMIDRVKKVPLPLMRVVDESTLICVGRVERVESVELPAGWNPTVRSSPAGPVAFDRIRVERVLEGDPSIRVVYHEAKHTWLCDSTSVPLDTRCVFFLTLGAVANASAEIRDALSTQFEGAPILASVGSGDGFVLVRTDENVPNVGVGDPPDVLLAGTRAQLEDPFERAILASRIPLDRFLAYVEDLSRFDRASVAVHARATTPLRPDEAPFDLRILPNGEARLSLGGVNEREVRHFTFSPEKWAVLRESLLERTKTTDVLYCRARTFEDAQRTLVVKLDGRRILFDEPGELSRSPIEPARREEASRCLQAWSLVRGAIDCASCVDHRASDENWLGK